MIQGQGNTSYYDAFVDIRSLGYNVSAGVIGFINIAIDPNTIPAAAGRGGGMGGGAMPSGGAVPSGANPRYSPWLFT